MEEKYVGKGVNLGCFTHFAIFFVALCCGVWYDDVREIAKDLHFIRQHIENSTLEITYRDSVAVDSVVVYKMK